MNYNKIFEMFRRCRLSGEYIDSVKNPMKIIRKAEKEKSFFKLSKNTHVCCFRYQEEDKNYVLILIIFVRGDMKVSPLNDFIMNVVDNLEKIFYPIDKYDYYTNMDGLDNNSHILQIMKSYGEND